MTAPAERRDLRRWAALAVALTVLAGAALRLVFVGHDPLGLGARFAAVRHAHSHLGYYLFLFPAAWLALRAAGGWVPGVRLAAAYGAVSLLAAAAFTVQGYGAVSIAASTAVGAVWAAEAVRRWRRFGDWRDASPVALALGLCLVVPIALMTRRDPPLAAHLARSFLTLLLLGALLPAWLGKGRWPAWAWLAATALAAFGGGFEWAPGRLVGYGACAVGLWQAVADAPLSHVARALWRATALGFAGYALGLPSAGHGASLAGVHFIALGPVAVQALLVRPGRPVSPLLWPYLATVGLMCAALLAGDLPWVPGSGLLATRVAAWSGVACAALLVAQLARRP
ncbi:MAG: hypothetical protein H6702_17885 [Myxococcales bacterium]|nr:hypothetical protein [Myxococcales bacterium]